MLIYGRNPLKETSPKDIKKIYLNKNLVNKEIFDYIREQKIKYDLVETKVLDKMVGPNHQGLVIDVFDYEYYNMDAVTEDFIVMLDHIEDPHNFGAIIRSCECAGVKTIIIPKNRSCLVNSTVVKVSCGAISNVKIVMVNNLLDAINKLKKDNYFIYGADMVGEDFHTVDYSGKKCLVVGNEGKGISKLIKDNCDFMIKIPMKGEINSLNASVATGIILFEMIR
ncbi:MAG: 23S rRNA (guanosine(2251)-2'-O)-methyltransferase RlmB [Bacilli bacterium]|nr:23S rRNA (guanosine(2251)-2'-O)-methyltransferase RlmB [Bacilli bacterium]